MTMLVHQERFYNDLQNKTAVSRLLYDVQEIGTLEHKYKATLSQYIEHVKVKVQVQIKR